MNLKLIEAKFEKYGMKDEITEIPVNQNQHSDWFTNLEPSTDSLPNRIGTGNYLGVFANSFKSVNTYKSKIKNILQKS